MLAQIEIQKQRIENIQADALCNSAGQQLLPGGGVDQAIHMHAGPALKKACQKLGGCNYGEAKITYAYKLPSQFIIHTNCPKWSGGFQNNILTLSNCYKNSLLLADYYGCQTIAFPAIGCGVRGFPSNLASYAAINSIRETLRSCKHIRRVILSIIDSVLFKDFNRSLTQAGNEIETLEFWCDFWIEENLIKPIYWVNILGMFHHHWATIQKHGRRYEIVFLNQTGLIFERIQLPSRAACYSFLIENKFERWGIDYEETKFIPFMDHCPHSIESDIISKYYS